MTNYGLEKQPAPQPIDPALIAQHFKHGTKAKRITAMAEEISHLNFQNAALQQQLQYLENYMNNHGGPELWATREALARERQKLADVTAENERQKNHVKKEIEEYRVQGLASAQAEIEELSQTLPKLRADAVKMTLGLENFTHPAESYGALQTSLRSVRDKMKRLASNGDAVYPDFYTDLPTTAAKEKQLRNNIAKLALRCYNAEAENIIKAITAANAYSSADKLGRAAEVIHKLTKPLNVSISTDYQELKMEELELAGQVEEDRKIDREEKKELREAMREQAKVEAELEAEKRRLEKELKHYESVLEKIQAVGDDERAAELREEITRIEAGIADVDYRKANQRAGYVYVISNIGSFGERMVKIGLTRRLDPMDRVKELGDASVPFNFDVHALFFSEDAVGVETALHQAFADRKVNRVNSRREFFYATPLEVKEKLTEIQGDLLEFVEIPEAEQFRASQSMAELED